MQKIRAMEGPPIIPTDPFSNLYWNCHGTVGTDRAMTFGAYVRNFGVLICA